MDSVIFEVTILKNCWTIFNKSYITISVLMTWSLFIAYFSTPVGKVRNINGYHQ